MGKELIYDPIFLFKDYVWYHETVTTAQPNPGDMLMERSPL